MFWDTHQPSPNGFWPTNFNKFSGVLRGIIWWADDLVAKGCTFLSTVLILCCCCQHLNPNANMQAWLLFGHFCVPVPSLVYSTVLPYILNILKYQEIGPSSTSSTGQEANSNPENKHKLMNMMWITDSQELWRGFVNLQRHYSSDFPPWYGGKTTLKATSFTPSLSYLSPCLSTYFWQMFGCLAM